jgi:NAD(P)-dependent dehydrogenase (short-subunit alcohol dehydrogenase family)
MGRFDHLVTTTSISAASLGVQTPMKEMAGDAARAFFEGKFWAQYQAAQAGLANLSADGSVVFTSGVASRKVLPGHTIVAANNAAIEAMARQLAREIAPRRVNVISPGLTDTRAYDHLPSETRREFFAHVTRQLPVPRPARPDEIATAYLFAMTAAYLTGTVIDIDGGLLVQ